MSTATLGSLNGQGTAQAWLTWTVKEFFTHVNWADQPPEVQAIQITTLEGRAPEISLQLTVSQFFAAIPWDGKAVAAPVATEGLMTPPEAAVSPAIEINVDDFADFF